MSSTQSSQVSSHLFLSLYLYNTVGVTTASVKLIGSIHFYQGKGGLDSPAARHVCIRNVKHCQTPQIVGLSASGCVTAVFCVLPRWRGCSGVDKGSGSLGSVTWFMFTLCTHHTQSSSSALVTWCQVSRKPFPTHKDGNMD